MFFHSATSLAEKKPAFVQSLHKMKSHFVAVKSRITIGFIGDYHFPSGRALNFLPFTHRNDAEDRMNGEACNLFWGWTAFVRATLRNLLANGD